MKIIETPIFTKKVISLLTQEEYRSLQNELITNPEKRKIIPGSGGLRKLRWGVSGRGKAVVLEKFIIGLQKKRQF